MNKNITQAIENLCMVAIDNKNYGIFATKKTTPKDVRLLWQNGIRVNYEDGEITQNGTIIAKIEKRYAARKVNGMYKQLKPKIVFI